MVFKGWTFLKIYSYIGILSTGPKQKLGFYISLGIVLVCHLWLIVQFFLERWKQALNIFDLDLLDNLMWTFLVLMTILLPNYFKQEQLQKFLEKSESLDLGCQVEIGLNFIQVLLSLYYAYSLYNDFTASLAIATCFGLFYVVSSVILQTYLLRKVLLKVHLVNQALEANLDLATTLYLDACDLIHLFNGSFGWLVLLEIVATYSNILRTIQNNVLAFEKPGRTLYFVLENLNLALPLLRFVHEGENIKKALKTSRNLARKDSIIFCRNPAITAAGFFNIDHALLFIFTNVSATIIIALLQYNH